VSAGTVVILSEYLATTTIPIANTWMASCWSETRARSHWIGPPGRRPRGRRGLKRYLHQRTTGSGSRAYQLKRPRSRTRACLGLGICQVLYVFSRSYGRRRIRYLQVVDSNKCHLMQEVVRAHKPEHFAVRFEQNLTFCKHSVAYFAQTVPAGRGLPPVPGPRHGRGRRRQTLYGQSGRPESIAPSCSHLCEMLDRNAEKCKGLCALNNLRH
jgi:hypothetical protein